MTMLKLGEFTKGDDVDPLSTPLSGSTMVQGLPSGILQVV
jgi:hypothetical protein